MATVTRRRALGILAGLTAVPLLAACPAASAEEPEDCDADDLLEGDDDCYGKSKKKKPKRKSKSRR